MIQILMLIGVFAWRHLSVYRAIVGTRIQYEVVLLLGTFRVYCVIPTASWVEHLYRQPNKQEDAPGQLISLFFTGYLYHRMICHLMAWLGARVGGNHGIFYTLKAAMPH